MSFIEFVGDQREDGTIVPDFDIEECRREHLEMFGTNREDIPDDQIIKFYVVDESSGSRTKFCYYLSDFFQALTYSPLEPITRILIPETNRINIRNQYIQTYASEDPESVPPLAEEKKDDEDEDELFEIQLNIFGQSEDIYLDADTPEEANEIMIVNTRIVNRSELNNHAQELLTRSMINSIQSFDIPSIAMCLRVWKLLVLQPLSENLADTQFESGLPFIYVYSVMYPFEDQRDMAYLHRCFNLPNPSIKGNYYDYITEPTLDTIIAQYPPYILDIVQWFFYYWDLSVNQRMYFRSRYWRFGDLLESISNHRLPNVPSLNDNHTLQDLYEMHRAYNIPPLVADDVRLILRHLDWRQKAYWRGDVHGIPPEEPVEGIDLIDIPHYRVKLPIDYVRTLYDIVGLDGDATTGDIKIPPELQESDDLVLKEMWRDYVVSRRLRQEGKSFTEFENIVENQLSTMRISPSLLAPSFLSLYEEMYGRRRQRPRPPESKYSGSGREIKIPPMKRRRRGGPPPRFDLSRPCGNFPTQYTDPTREPYNMGELIQLSEAHGLPYRDENGNLLNEDDLCAQLILETRTLQDID